MTDPSSAPQMSREIFQLGLAVETVSAYLLCCALAQEGRAVRHQDLLAIWNAAPAALEAALTDLLARNIVAREQTGDVAGTLYRPQPATVWRGA